MDVRSVGKIRTVNYLKGRETSRRRELVWGVVREPAAPYFVHQDVVTRLAVLLEPQVRARQLGKVCVAPVDVILDYDRALILQPDLVFVATDRLHIIDRRIQGAPDLVIEVLSLGTRRYDRQTKLRLYRRYGVRECWLVDPVSRDIEVVAFRPGRRRRTRSAGTQPVKSDVLADIRLSAAAVFEGIEPPGLRRL
jgi:Uma2 family endonuclease